MLSKEILHNIENKIVVSEKPFPHTILNNFLPEEIVKSAEKEFGNIKKKNYSEQELSRK